MASFIEDLWSSVFTPGPTPTLLVATNAAFAALQLILFLLLIATHSIHFIVLSILSAGLWWSINWFAREIQEAQTREEAEKKKQQQHQEQGTRSLRPMGISEITDSDTETEGPSNSKTRKSKILDPTSNVSRSTSTPLSPPDESLRKRRSVGADSSGYLSTDSEWEKVDDEKSSSS
jgi:hypothetical protein